MLSNAAVIASFVSGRMGYAKNGSMLHCGSALSSYDTVIAEWLPDGAVAVNPEKYSVTTTGKHQNPLKGALARAGFSPTDETSRGTTDGWGRGTPFVVWRKAD